MVVEFLISIAVITTTALIWRALLLDHPVLLARVESIPVLGGALRCGFCTALWLSLCAVVIYNPLSPLFAGVPSIISTWLAWFTTGAAVLLLRNTITVLIEATGVLTHQHRSTHKDQ